MISLPMSRQDRVRKESAAGFGQDFSAQTLSQSRQSHPLVAVEVDSPGAEFLAQDFGLLLEVLDHVLLMPLDRQRRPHGGLGYTTSATVPGSRLPQATPVLSPVQGCGILSWALDQQEGSRSRNARSKPLPRMNDP